MKINGREVKFCRTVEVNCKIADLCTDGNIDNISTLLDGKYQDSQRTSAKFISIMSEGYEKKKKFQEPGYEPHPLTFEETMTLEDEEFRQAFREAIEAWSGEKITVDTVPVKKTGKRTQKSS